MSQLPSIFKIPMLGKFLDTAAQNTNGQFIEGEVYVITGYNPDDDTVQTTGRTSRNRWVDAAAFEVVRNNMWTFQHGHLAGMEGIIGDIAKFEDHGHDDHIEALSFSPFMHVDLASSPDYSATGRYIGPRWPELHEQRPARPLAADENQHIKDYNQYKACLPDTDFAELERRAAAAFNQSPQRETHRERFDREHEHLDTLVRGRHGKSTANYIFATGHADALRTSAKARRFAAMFKAGPAHIAPTDDIAEAILAATSAMMGVSPRLLSGAPVNCRCAMPELKKGLHSESKGMFILDDTYAATLEDGKPTQTATFVRNALEANDKFRSTIRARIERGMNAVHLDTSAMPEVYNRMVECERDIGAFVKGCTYRAMVTGSGPGIKVEHPHTAVPMPVPRDYFKTTGPIPCAVDDRDAPLDPMGDFDFEGAAQKKVNSPDFPLESELADESTFVHKSATRKTQEVHEENDGTANLRKYRFNPDTQ